MNSPNMRSEQLTPKMSPISLCLDDPKNSSAFQSLLASPTKLNLDNTSGFYSTSLSKLNDYARSGRSRERRDSETFRSISPIRFNLATSNNNNNALGPKMLKSEYLTQKKTNLPLLSTLLKSAASTKDTNRKSATTNATSSSSINITDNSMLIRETLDQIQQQQKNLQKFNKTKTKTSKTTKKTVETQLSDTNEMNIKENTTTEPVISNKLAELSLRSNSIVSGGSTLENEYSGEIEVKKRNEREKDISFEKDRVVSNTSTMFHSQIQNNDTSTDFSSLNVESFPIDKNGFIDMNTHQKYSRNPHNISSNGGNINSPTLNNKQNNRFSFISSTSTDYEFLFDQQAVPNVHGPQTINSQQPPPNHHQPQFPYSQSSVSNSNSNVRSAQEMETSKLDLKIKYLEIEIQELKLQNEKLVNSMNVNRTTEDNLLIELLRQKTGVSEENSIADSNSEFGSTTTRKNRSMEKKVKMLEKKFEDYKKVLEKLNYIDQNMSIEDSTPVDIPDFKRRTRKSKRNTLRLPKVSRISRISSIDLRRIEENSDYSSLVISSKNNVSSNEEDLIDEYEEGCFDNSDLDEGDALEYEADDEKESHPLNRSIQLIKKNSKRGLQLHLPIQK
ncbi:similar to Saccharomyces cerevisiae YLR190W MMR1 Phosphorylated protein of the mitochondrial outer membrane, localizes only to mitochondria of the bud [Maudiozyma saulgeensis]|uniref:Similar to Saccharomyces cerevisiae YLR190W MMR1 Phosphorylated protein of the mitochondrial outer membrane, localizes only to mitochondria of the bud n=1 Tax=Maudiozyma saulgeensis TaxID=1789683 RepID=A0A1X7R2L2_9SACH|nr:similar to Saccharomyces cerevisiae YLR190W MMR1 Phosphorylated protein of the mitochondrial outer membrane, localizes only to mitochondria of the bud [Kazachstania saulgeensis]